MQASPRPKITTGNAARLPPLSPSANHPPRVPQTPIDVGLFQFAFTGARASAFAHSSPPLILQTWPLQTGKNSCATQLRFLRIQRYMI